MTFASAIRGPTWEQEGRVRHFYTVFARGQLRASDVGIRFDVPLGFCRGVFNACGHWVADHLQFEDDPRAHLASQGLPSWVPSLIEHVDFDVPVGRGAVVTMCAELLDVSTQQVYAQLA